MPGAAMNAARPTRIVVCPTCKGPSRFSSDNRWRPFCSERCRSIDLGAWASESYRVDAAPSADDEAPSERDPKAH
jgi:endogenous inhibitor of DNA gyrase (YacG/DUF329 family)